MIDIDVSKALKQPGQSFNYEFNGTPEVSGIEFTRPLALNAAYCVVDGGIRAAGEFFTTVSVECARCLDPVSYDIVYDFDEVFTRRGQDDSYTYSGEVLSLDKMVSDAVLLSIPQQVLCADDCHGLCGSCGANLNHKTCNCGDEESPVYNPFIKLKELQ